MTGNQNTQPLCETERDFLEMLLYKLSVMREHGAAWYARKMPGDERLFKAAKKDVNDYILKLNKKGYTAERYRKAYYIQPNLL